MSTSTSRTIPLQVLSEPAAAPAPLEVGAKQLGSDKIARSPVQFADAPVLRKPSWIRVRIPAGNAVANLKARLRENRLVTVCEEASCPHIHAASATWPTAGPGRRTRRSRATWPGPSPTCA